MTDWQEMYVFPYAPHDRWIEGLTSDSRQVECHYHPIRQQWVDRDDKPVTITHWRQLLVSN